MKRVTFAAIAAAALIVGAPVIAQIVPAPGNAPAERLQSSRSYGWGPA